MKCELSNMPPNWNFSSAMVSKSGGRKTTGLIIVLTIVCSPYVTIGFVRFTNLKCQTLDVPFVTFPYCFIKSTNRTHQYISLKVDLHQLPVESASFRWTLLKKANGYRPFLYNISLDACKFLRNPKANIVAHYLYQAFEKYSNINSTCPIVEDLIVEKLPNHHLNHQFSNVLPFPIGEYQLDTSWSAYGVERARLKVYIALT